jgi:hypothetical protein
MGIFICKTKNIELQIEKEKRTTLRLSTANGIELIKGQKINLLLTSQRNGFWEIASQNN